MTKRDTPVEVSGGCLCGAVRYRALVLLRSAYVCHCNICRRSTGQPSEIGVPVVSGSLRFVHGEPQRYTSSPHGQRAFCGTCGSRLAWLATDPENDWLSSVNVGSLDDPAPVQVDCHIFARQELPWVAQIAHAPRYNEEDGEELLARWHAQRVGEAQASAQD